jgi:hypothetical protein
LRNLIYTGLPESIAKKIYPTASKIMQKIN